MISDETGKELPATDVFAHSIWFVKSDIEKRLKEANVSMQLPDDVHYILTCPAIWCEQSKLFMRHAAMLVRN